MQIISRSDARKTGAKRFFSGVPCRRYGHVAWRSVSNGECSKCASERAKVSHYKDHEGSKERLRKYGKENKEKRTEYRAEWYENNKEYFRQWRASNSESALRSNRKYRAENREKRQEGWRSWASKNQDKVAQNTRNRRARRYGNGGSHTNEDVANILKMQKNKCAYCKTVLKGKYHIDHIVALSKGGQNDRRNLQILCASCNQRKHARDPHEFVRQEFGMLI